WAGVLGSAQAAAAAFVLPEDVDQQQFRVIADDLRCPTCVGLSVLNSDEKFALQIKEKVVEDLRLGKSREEIMAYFLERYGPWILREPPREGFHGLAWQIPIAILLLGPLVLWILFWRRRRDYDTL